MEKITKKDLADLLAEKIGCTKKDAAEAVNIVFEEIAQAMSADKTVDISGFGKFVVKTRSARVGINPATGEKIEISASKAPGFKAAKGLKELCK